ncbi:MAG: lipid-A-disaccharide synthase [Verrucomicrobia bacterium]|nr:lipid-A-disaccharide synthase [Verrucomicrobiota bacterium]
MSQPSFMLIAGEPSGDQIAAELVMALRRDPGVLQHEFAPRFYGAGGPQLAAAGVELKCDMTRYAVVGLWEVLKQLGRFRRLLRQLVALACERRPDVVVCVDFGGFNLRFASALRSRLRSERGIFHNWRPRLVQYVSPQVWASRPGRARRIAETFDLLLSILPFERAWYAREAPGLPVEFVGHPLLDRHSGLTTIEPPDDDPIPTVALLPGSRRGELRAHLPVMLVAARRIREAVPARFEVVLAGDQLADEARQLAAATTGLELSIHISGLGGVLRRARVALACTGTVTLECALYGVPTVALYRTSPLTYQVARRVVTVRHLAMPNLLAGAEVFPEFIQSAATPENLASAALVLLTDANRRAQVRARLAEVVASLGGPGASRRAAAAISRLLSRGCGHTDVPGPLPQTAA